MTLRWRVIPAALATVLLCGCVALHRDAGAQAVAASAQRSLPPALHRLSRPTGAVASSGDPTGAVSGDPTLVWSPDRSEGAWVAIPLQAPAPETLVLTWNAVGFGFENLAAAPRTYRLAVSADSTDGVDGSWRQVLSVTANPVRAHAETLHAPGARWVKLTVEATWHGQLALRDLLVYGSAARSDLACWHVCGDSISDGSFNAIASRDFATTVAAALPGHVPVLVDGATPSDNAQQGLERLTKALPFLPPGGYVAIAFGTNDCAQGAPLATYRARMQALVDLVRRSGRTPMLARMPWFPHPRVGDYVAVVDALTDANHLPPGPDLFGWFQDHPDELGKDRIHPNATGRRSVQRLWGEAAVRAYGRQ